MPDPGITGKPEEIERRENLVVIVAENAQSLSFASCPTCPGPRRTPTLHVGCTPGNTAGKDTEAEVNNKELNASSSSSSSELAGNEGKSLQVSNCPLCKFQRQLSLKDSEKEGPVIIDPEVFDVTSEQGIAQVVWAASSNPGPSTPVLKGKRKAEADIEDGPVSPAKKNQKPAVSEADKEAKDKAESGQYWEHRDPTIFGDSPDQPGTTYGRGLCRQIQLETLSLSNLDDTHDSMDIPMDEIELQRASTSVQPQFVTLFVAGFVLDTANYVGDRMLTSFTDELHESDPEGVGLDGLDILHKLPGTNADEPSSINDQGQF